jgi:predicted chitinase
LADTDSVVAVEDITRRISGGLTKVEERQTLFNLAKEVLGIP